MAETIKLDGFAELEKVLEGLSDKSFAKNLVKSALRRAAKPLIKSAQSKVSVDTGLLKKSITINYQSRDGSTIGVGPKRKGGQVITLGDGTGYVVGMKDPWYAHFVEFGTSRMGKYRTGKKVRINGRTRAERVEKVNRKENIPARPFMRPAFEETKQEVIDNFGKSIWDSIEKYAAKHAVHVT